MAAPTSSTATRPSTVIEDLNVAFKLTPEDDRVVFAATEHLVGGCLTRQGFKYSEQVYVDPPSGNAPGRFDYPDPALVDKFGYAWAAGTHRAEISAPTSGEVPALTPDEAAARERCLTIVADQLGLPKFADASGRISSENAQIAQRVSSDRRMLDALADWSRCMASNGYEASTVKDADALAAANTTADGIPGKAAIAIAVADFACRHAAHIQELARELNVAGIAVWLEANPGAIEDFHSAVHELVSRAKDSLR